MFLNMLNQKMQLVEEKDALPGRNEPIVKNLHHAVHQHSLHAPFPEGYKTLLLGMGCFWGAERLFWQLPGVYITAVGYAGGFTKNPTYEEVCSGLTGHTEVVLVVYNPKQLSLGKILSVFFEEHNPTEGMRQGNDIGTNYRSCIYVNNEDGYQLAQKMRNDYEQLLLAHGKSAITTEIAKDIPFYYAEEAHQQYLHKVPNGYCGLKGAGVSCPLPR